MGSLLGPTVPEGNDGGDASVPARGALVDRFLILAPLGSGGMGVVLLAFDPDLDRKVALKLLRDDMFRDEATIGHARLVAEAQAMARLQHPNAVAVHEIGFAEAGAFVVMEHVEGCTLRVWLRERPRPWREVLAMFLGAGAGLAAAHREGIVHRDFKPENVLVGSDGRPRVADFGLAAAASAGDGSPAGSVAGTLPYMPPEQLAGDPTDARADQFAFAVALWEGLYGVRPFAGSTIAERQAAIAAGPREPPRGRRVPERVRAALARALQAEPARRWPSLDALLAALRHERGGRAAWLALGGAGVAAAAVAFALVPRSGALDPCPAPAARLAAVWGPARRAAVERHLLTVDPTVGAQRYAAAAAVFERALPSWSDMHVAACRATRVEGRQSDTLLDARMRCLDDWLGDLDGVVVDLAHATSPRQVEGAIKGISSLGSLAHCADTATLEAETPPPKDPAARAEAEAIAGEVKALQLARHAGNLAGLPARADALVARARALGHAPTLTRALGLRWRLAVSDQDIAGAVAILRETVEVAARAHNDQEAARAWSMMVKLVGMYQRRPDEARAIMPAARAASARAGDPSDLLVWILNDEASALSSGGDTEHALADLAEARRLLEAAGAAERGSPLLARLGAVLQSIGTTYQEREEPEKAIPLLREALALDDRAFGPDTVDSGADLLALAQALRDHGDLAEAEAAARESVRIRAARNGDSPSLAMALSGLCDIVGKRGRFDEAVAIGERAVSMARAKMPPDDATLAILIKLLGDAYDRAGRPDRALALYDEILATAERTKIASTHVAGWWIDRGDVRRRVGRCAEALEDFGKGAAMGERVEGEGSHQIGSGLRGQGRCLHDLHRDAEAIAALERSLRYPAPPSLAVDVDVARGLLGELLVDTGRDRTRGLALAREASEKLRAEGTKDRFVAQLDGWLRRRP
jgi:eukaryotic-like serine/threonine-protein kinase